MGDGCRWTGRGSRVTCCPRLSSYLCYCGDQLLAIPDGLELLRNRELRLWRSTEQECSAALCVLTHRRSKAKRGQKNAHKFSVFAGYQDVHLGALGADDLAVQRIAAQVHVATIRLVDGDGGDLPHDLGR